MESSIVKWVEVEPGAPLPPEIPPWSARFELVQRAGLSDTARRALQATGVMLMGGGLATAVLAGSGASYADLYGALAAVLGLVILFAGLIGVPPSAKYVPSANGRFVPVEEPKAPAPLEAEASTFDRWFVRVCLGGCSAALVALFGYMIASGSMTLETAKFCLLMLVPTLGPGLFAAVHKAIRRRLKSEAEVSERFLQASDPRTPLDAITPGYRGSIPTALPASTGTAPDGPSPEAAP